MADASLGDETPDFLLAAELDHAQSLVDWRYWRARVAQQPSAYAHERLALAGRAMADTYEHLQHARCGIDSDG